MATTIRLWHGCHGRDYWNSIAAGRLATMRTVGYLLVGITPGAALFASEVSDYKAILVGIGTLVAGVLASVALLRKGDSSIAIAALKETVDAIKADHARCVASHAASELRQHDLIAWMRRNKGAMEQSGVKLEQLPISLD